MIQLILTLHIVNRKKSARVFSTDYALHYGKNASSQNYTKLAIVLHFGIHTGCFIVDKFLLVVAMS